MPVAHHPDPLDSPAEVNPQAVGGHSVGDGVEQALTRGAVAIAVHGRVLDGRHRHRGLFRFKAKADVHGFPRTVLLVLAKNDAELGQATHAAAVEDTGPLLKHIDEDQAQRTPDGRVGSVAGAEQVVGAVQLNLAPDRSVDDGQQPGGVGYGGYLMNAVGIEFEQRLHRRQHDGEIAGSASRHYGIGRGLLRGQGSPANLNFSQHGVGSQANRIQHGLHPVRRGRHHGQAVSPAPPVTFLDSVQAIGILDHRRSLCLFNH